VPRRNDRSEHQKGARAPYRPKEDKATGKIIWLEKLLRELRKARRKNEQRGSVRTWPST